jgi:hypothetical protein
VKQGREEARGYSCALGRPTLHEKEIGRLGSARAKQKEREKSRPVRSRPPSYRAAQVNLFSFPFFSFSHLHLFSKPFNLIFKSKSIKIKTTPHYKTNATA